MNNQKKNTGEFLFYYKIGLLVEHPKSKKLVLEPDLHTYIAIVENAKN